MGVAPAGKTRFEGTIANTGGSLFLGGFFNVRIDEWTTPEEAAELKKILMVGGQKALLDKVWKAKQIGSLQISNSMGKPLFFARAIPVPGGLIVRALTNSPLGHGGGRAGDYPFGFIELIIPNDGKGYGTIVGMARSASLRTAAPRSRPMGQSRPKSWTWRFPRRSEISNRALDTRAAAPSGAAALACLS